MPRQKQLLILLSLLIWISGGCTALNHAGTQANHRGIQFIESPKTIRVEINGGFFTEYHFADAARPYYYPLMGLGNLPMTRNWPMTAGENEEHDHPHHRSLWFAHGLVNGVNFWSEEKSFGKIVHEKFTRIESGKKVGVIASSNNWVGPDGRIVCTDDRTMRIYNRPGARMFDFEITIHASHGPVTLGDTKEGTMAVRLAESMRLKGKIGHGHIINSAGVRDDATWGKRADWCDYYGPVDGKIVGVAIFDHPANPRHPTWWHVRDYGLFAVNPFGWHDFEKKPANSGDFLIPAGHSVTFRYRFYLHEGDEQQARVAEMYREYAGQKFK